MLAIRCLIIGTFVLIKVISTSCCSNKKTFFLSSILNTFNNEVSTCKPMKHSMNWLPNSAWIDYLIGRILSTQGIYYNFLWPIKVIIPRTTWMNKINAFKTRWNKINAQNSLANFILHFALPDREIVKIALVVLIFNCETWLDILVSFFSVANVLLMASSVYIIELSGDAYCICSKCDNLF